jgi:hypothetical protein
MLWGRMLAYITGRVNQELLLRNEYLGAENLILRGKIKGRLLLSKGEKATLAEIAHRLGREALENLQQRRTRTPFSAGIESSSRTSLTDRDFADEQVDRGLMKKSSVWSCKWRKKIPAGATVAWWAP